MAGEKKSYSPQEAQEILRRAAEKSVDRSDAIEHDDLLDAARDAGLDPAAVEAAAQEYAVDRAHQDTAAKLRTEWRKGLAAHALTYFVVNIALYFGAQLSKGNTHWWTWVAGIWGVFLLLNVFGALKEPTREEIERTVRREAQAKQRIAERAKLNAEREQRRSEAQAIEEQKRQTKEQRREQKLARMKERKAAQDALSQAIDKSVNAAMQVAAKSLESVAEQVAEKVAESQPDTDFAKYVASKKQGAAKKSKVNSSTNSEGSMPPVATPGVRVSVAGPPIPSVVGDRNSDETESAPAQANESKRRQR